jgi:hypothetical protein
VRVLTQRAVFCARFKILLFDPVVAVAHSSTGFLPIIIIICELALNGRRL